MGVVSEAARKPRMYSFMGPKLEEMHLFEEEIRRRLLAEHTPAQSHPSPPPPAEPVPDDAEDPLLLGYRAELQRLQEEKRQLYRRLKQLVLQSQR